MFQPRWGGGLNCYAEKSWILVLGLYCGNFTVVHWLQNTRDESCSLGLLWPYLKSRVPIHLLLSVLWLLMGTWEQSCWMPQPEHQVKTHAATAVWWSWHLCNSPVGSTFLESYHLYRINECPSTYASEHGVQSQSHGRQGETFPWFRWATDQSCGCMEAHLIWLRSSMVLHWGGFLQWLLFPAGAVVL